MKIIAIAAVIVTVIAVVAEAGDYDYNEVIEKSLLFYEAQRAGPLPSSNRIPWRGDSMLEDKDGNIDLVGGYFDAGDHVKFNFPGAYTMTTLAFGGIDFAAGYAAAGQTEELLDAVRWGVDYYLKCHSADNILYAQVGDGDADHSSWDRPEAWTAARPTARLNPASPGSDLAGETAAAFASASILFNSSDVAYSAKLLDHARRLYNFAKVFEGKYSDSLAAPNPFYTSWGYLDELAWAAAWLHRATNEVSYLNEAKEFYNRANLQWNHGFSWDMKSSGADVLLFKATNDELYRNSLQDFCDYTIDEVARTPLGLTFHSEWGSLRASSNVVFICLLAADAGIQASKYNDYGKQQIDYMLGDGGRSYVVGFGNNPPTHAHHRAASCPSPPAPCGWDYLDALTPNPHVLYGALVGGPGIEDDYVDTRRDAVKNEVAVDYNAAFQGALASLTNLKAKRQI